MPRFIRSLLAALISIVTLCGCGSEDRLATAPARGKITLDGRPLAGAEIWLVPTDANPQVKNAKITIRPYAKSDADGAFVLTSYLPDDGAPLGEYSAMVVPARSQFDQDLENDLPATMKGGKRAPFPSKYTNPRTSGLVVTVKEGENQLALGLKSK